MLKGTKLYVEGKPSAGAYIDKQGQPQADMRLQVIAIELLGQPQPKTDGAVAVPQGQPETSVQQAPTQQFAVVEDNIAF